MYGCLRGSIDIHLDWKEHSADQALIMGDEIFSLSWEQLSPDMYLRMHVGLSVPFGQFVSIDTVPNACVCMCVGRFPVTEP